IACRGLGRNHELFMNCEATQRTRREQGKRTLPRPPAPRQNYLPISTPPPDAAPDISFPPLNRPVDVRVEGLSKRYGPFWAIRDASFDVHAGEILGLIGPNA